MAKFEVSFIYRVNSKIARATQRNLISSPLKTKQNKQIKALLYAYGCSACMCVCALCVCFVSVKAERKHQISCNWIKMNVSYHVRAGTLTSGLWKNRQSF